jgi:hypothetical protein
MKIIVLPKQRAKLSALVTKSLATEDVLPGPVDWIQLAAHKGQYGVYTLAFQRLGKQSQLVCTCPDYVYRRHARGSVCKHLMQFFIKPRDPRMLRTKTGRRFRQEAICALDIPST